MAKTYVLLDHVLEKQKGAVDPEANVWVHANAGSGKTHVLSERVIRLLLDNVDPARILCLTYTKAAASVMKSRIFERLGRWALSDDTLLRQEIEALTQRKSDEQQLSIARQLFARALETPGGLRIQTIHAFCESILHRFPLEANVMGHFSLIDEAESEKLKEQAYYEVLERIHRNKTSLLHMSFERVFKSLSETVLWSLSQEIFKKQYGLQDFFCRLKSEGCDYETYVQRELGLDSSEKYEHSEKSFIQAAYFLEEYGPILESHGGKRAKEFVRQFQDIIKKSVVKKEDFYTVYFTKDGKLRSLSQILTKSVLTYDFTLEAIFQEAFRKLDCLRRKLDLFALVDLNNFVFLFAEELIKSYRNLKKMRGVLDFEDLIFSTISLLQRQQASVWVQFKLDQTIEHILLDEAQDTNSEQWLLLQLLSEEFFSGAGQTTKERTIFAVGDEKQSIYGFRGTDPKGFAENKRYFARQARNVEKTFKDIQLDFSFRSGKSILSAVDEVFSIKENYEGLSAQNLATHHAAIRKDALGFVDLWPSIEEEDTPLPLNWHEIAPYPSRAEIKLAERIAQFIRYYLQNKLPIGGCAKKLNPGDIMILVRQRNRVFINALTKLLKSNNIPVAGADRLRLLDHIAVQDLIALGSFLLQPEDDLSLASIFKSPLFNLSEEDLAVCAIGRSGSLWSNMVYLASKDEGGPIGCMVKRLQAYRSLIDNVPVFEFYSHILNEEAGRKAFIGRFGSEVVDILDAFLQFSLDLQKSGEPSLQIFLERLQEGEGPEIKREQDHSKEEVRILTVHGAKGLEASLVFLVDFGTKIFNAQKADKILMKQETNFKKSFIWVPNIHYKLDWLEKENEITKLRAEEEYKRLLYVGMTRAEDALIVCGCHIGSDNKEGKEKKWLERVEEALKDKMERIEYPFPFDCSVLRYSVKDSIKEEEVSDKDFYDSEEESFDKLPAYFKEKLVHPPSFVPPISPSKTGLTIEKESFSLAPKSSYFFQNKEREDPSYNLLRGNILHKVLQYIPFSPIGDWESCAKSFLDHQAFGLTDVQKESLLAEIQGLINQPLIIDLFSEDGRSEASIMGEILLGGKYYPINARIDRITVKDNCILLGDYKTGIVPLCAEDIPYSHIIQLALYTEIVRPLYKNKEIIPLLIYTRGPACFSLQKEQMAAAMEAYMDTLRKH